MIFWSQSEPKCHLLFVAFKQGAVHMYVAKFKVLGHDDHGLMVYCIKTCTECNLTYKLLLHVASPLKISNQSSKVFWVPGVVTLIWNFYARLPPVGNGSINKTISQVSTSKMWRRFWSSLALQFFGICIASAANKTFQCRTEETVLRIHCNNFFWKIIILSWFDGRTIMTPMDTDKRSQRPV